MRLFRERNGKDKGPNLFGISRKEQRAFCGWNRDKWWKEMRSERWEAGSSRDSYAITRTLVIRSEEDLLLKVFEQKSKG
jgi:hypothetical protein